MSLTIKTRNPDGLMTADRPLWPFVLWLVGGFFVGVLAAPHLFNLLVWVGRTHQLAFLRTISFNRVAQRSVFVGVLLAFYPAVRSAGIRRWSEIGLPPRPGWPKTLLSALMLGIVTMGFVYVAGMAAGVYRFAPQSMGKVISRSLVYIPGALLVGLIEEPFFRGGIYGLTRRRLNIMPAAMLVSVFFAAVHFAGPDPRVPVVHGHWYSGLRLLGSMFTAGDLYWRSGMFALVLFFMGVSLCWIYEARGSLYAAIGLHAGWVWALKMGRYLFERYDDGPTVWFGTGVSVSKSGAAVLLSMLFAAGAFLCLWRSKARAK